MGLFDFLKKDTKNNNGNYTNRDTTSNDKYHYKEVVVYNPPGQHMMILKESLELMEKTINPSTFFSREKLSSEKALYCSEEPNIIWHGMNCEQIYRMLNDKDKKIAFDNRFIDRLFERGVEDRLAYQINEVGYSMYKESRDYYVRKLNGKKFYFCKVKFPDTDKLYTYITKDKSIREGDSVTVPTGNGFVPDTKLKQVVETFEASLDDLEFPIERLRCIEEKLKNINCPNCGASIEVDVGAKTGTCKYCQAKFYLLG